MNPASESLRIALCAWEIGRAGSGFGAKVGGLGVIVEELPPELVRAAARQGIRLTVDTFSPCFAHYDRTRLRRLPTPLPVEIDGHRFDCEAYERVVTETVPLPTGRGDEEAAVPVDFRFVYVWDEGQLHWTNAGALYAADPWVALRQYATVGQAIAALVRAEGHDTVHLHDYHVGLVPFFLAADVLEAVPVHLTIHNATYQGTTPAFAGGARMLARLGLPERGLFERYFEHFGELNPLKACMRRVHELGGRITTVSGDLDATWGYAAELRKSHGRLHAEALRHKGGPPGEVFVPNRHLDLFEKLPIAGITNGMAARNRPADLPELRAAHLRSLQAGRAAPLFRDPVVQREMLAADHAYSVEDLAPKAALKRLLHRECFGCEPPSGAVIVTAVGRLVDQKNLGLVPDCIGPVVARQPDVRFVILASGTPGDDYGAAAEAAFARAAAAWPDNVWFHGAFDAVLSKLILAGGDFALVPSRFEPCGLVDYEASLLGTVVIGRRTGGLAKVDHCAWLYDWYDAADTWGEARALTGRILTAVDVYHANRPHHDRLVRDAMRIDASWDASARQYVDLYRYGRLAKRWLEARRRLVARFGAELGADRDVFAQFFRTGRAEFADRVDDALLRLLRGGDGA